MILELKAKKDALLAKQEALVAIQATAGKLSAEQEKEFNDLDTEITALSATIARAEKVSAGRGEISKTTSTPVAVKASAEKKSGIVLSEDYQKSFHTYVASKGRIVAASMQEGSGADGGYVVPVTTDGNIIPLASVDSTMRQLATVVTTTNDVKYPRQDSNSVADQKDEATSTRNGIGQSCSWLFPNGFVHAERFSISGCPIHVLRHDL